MCFFRKTQVYTCFGNEQYFKIINKLNSAGIQHYTRFINHNSGGRGSFRLINQTLQYDIYVRKEDEHAALQAIHKNY